MKNFATSDLHIGHKNILNFTDRDGKKIRPFDSLEEMHQVILRNWNSTITDEDNVYVLGDIGFNKGQTEEFLMQAKGKKHLILGNHDTFLMSFYEGYFDSISVWKTFKTNRSIKVIMTHAPLHPQSFEYRAPYNVHGHTHNSNITIPSNTLEIDDTRYINVSVERTNYFPVDLDNLINNHGDLYGVH